MPVRFRTLFVSLERQCLLPLHSRNFSTLLLPAMTTASTSTNDHAALSSTESPAATIGGAAGVHVAPLLPPMQLSGHSGAPDTTAGTTYEGVLFGISAETIKWAKDRKDPPMSRHDTNKSSESALWCGFQGADGGGSGLRRLPAAHAKAGRALSLRAPLIKEAVDPVTASIIVGGAQSPSEMFDRHFESVAMRTCDSNWSIMRKYDSTSIMAQVSAALNVAMKLAELAAEHQSSCTRAMERPVDDLIEARGRIQAMEEATLGGEDWKPILPLLKPVAVAPAACSGSPCNNYNSWRVCITNLSPLSCRAVTSASRPRRYLSGIASSASVLWFRGRIPHRSRFLTSAHDVGCLRSLVEGSYPPPLALSHVRVRVDARSRRTGWALPLPAQLRADVLDVNFQTLRLEPLSVALSEVVTSGIASRASVLVQGSNPPPFALSHVRVRVDARSRRTGWALPRPPQPRADVLDSNLRFSLPGRIPHVRASSRPRIASSASVLWFRGRISHRSRFLTSAADVLDLNFPDALSAAPADPLSITELPMHGVGRASLEPVAAGSKEDVPFVPSMPAPGPSPAPETSARMRIMAREVDSFHDAMYKIVPPLDAPAFKANIKALEKVAHVAPYLAAIPKQIRKGFDFGIKDPPSERHIAKNAPLTEEQQLVMDGEMERMLDLGYIAGPYDKDELEAAVGPFRTNPISCVPTSVAPGMPPKWRQIEKLSYPKTLGGRVGHWALRHCIANGERKAVSRARRLDRSFSTSFEALLIPSKLALASDACMHGLGIAINGYSAYFALPEGDGSATASTLGVYHECGGVGGRGAGRGSVTNVTINISFSNVTTPGLCLDGEKGIR
ncbi:BQ5605_C096g13090 [Microbotryum silenes-dioicae]|uniref:BQ5605_C096g13090 protein n=1 Tax=Microbotryum silenes-dioicae TaxID=796604 RepID=A0A2X0LRV1_9BASI|nr:BQ5605_C096g13090 [Microbotryum silenes-dioicae]